MKAFCPNKSNQLSCKQYLVVHRQPRRWLNWICLGISFYLLCWKHFLSQVRPTYQLLVVGHRPTRLSVCEVQLMPTAWEVHDRWLKAHAHTKSFTSFATKAKSQKIPENSRYSEMVFWSLAWPVVDDTMAVYWSIASRNWPIMSGIDWIRLT